MMMRTLAFSGLLLAVPTAVRAMESNVSFYPSDYVRVEGIAGGRVKNCAWGLAVGVEADRPWSGVRLRFGSPRDVTSWREIVASVTNLTDRPLVLKLHAKTPGKEHNFLFGETTLAPCAAGEIVVPIAPGIHLSPFQIPGLRGYETDGAHLTADDLRQIGLVNVFRPRGPDRAAFGVLSVFPRTPRNDPWPAVAEKDFFPFADRFGQYRHADWPGKTHDETDLVAARAEEDAWLSAHAESPIRGGDRFGGWSAGPQLRATGFFRTEKVNGRWWLVDPDGRLFWSQGIVGVRVGHATGVSGREKLFAWLPAKDDPVFASCWRRVGGGAARSFYRDFGPYEEFSFARANMIRKYGSDFLPVLTSLVHRRLRAWGINTIGNWSDAWALADAPLRTPYTDWIESKARPIKTNLPGHDIPDVFSPDFAVNLEKAVVVRAKRSGADPWCVGWFVDNEIAWGETDDALARTVLAAPNGQPAKAAFLKRLAEKGIDPTNVPYEELCAFSRLFEETYFSTVRAMVKKHAPNRLYLGCRFLSRKADAVWRTASRFCDVMSVNVYRDVPSVDLPDGCEDRPLLIGEYHFGALDRGLLHAGLVPAHDQADRADRYRRYVRAALASKRIVGAHWFLWRDQALTGRSDGECFQSGFLDVTDRPYPEMVTAACELAGEIYPKIEKKEAK